MKKPLKITLIAICCLVAVAFAVGYALFRHAILADTRDIPDSERWETAERNYPGINAWFSDVCDNGYLTDTTMTSGGYTLHAWMIGAAENTRKTAVVVHGYCSSPINMMMIARMYREDFGFNVILPHQKNHAESEGDHIQMGWNDRLDVLKWSEIAHSRFGDTLQVVHGISMGGATTMMLSGETTPDYLKGFVEDCGYTSAWDEFAYKAKTDYHLPAWPVLNIASGICKRRYGWDFKEASSVKQVGKSTKPMLFIHGSADDFVPYRMLQPNYDAKISGYKQIWTAEGSEHAMSYRDYPEEYTAQVAAFLQHLQ